MYVGRDGERQGPERSGHDQPASSRLRSGAPGSGRRARDGSLLLALVAAAVLVIVIAPVAEEFFFRGFFYRALRTKLSIALAAIVNGAVFGLIHFEGVDTLEILPVLAVLGVIFCLVYEWTGSLFAVIALHSLNNFLAFAGETEEWAVAGIVGGTAIAACFLVPLLLRRQRAPALR